MCRDPKTSQIGEVWEEVAPPNDRTASEPYAYTCKPATIYELEDRGWRPSWESLSEWISPEAFAHDMALANQVFLEDAKPAEIAVIQSEVRELDGSHDLNHLHHGIYSVMFKDGANLKIDYTSGRECDDITYELTTPDGETFKASHVNYVLDDYGETQSNFTGRQFAYRNRAKSPRIYAWGWIARIGYRPIEFCCVAT